MLASTTSSVDQVTQSCLQCHDACLRTIAHKGSLPNASRESLVAQLHGCADICRTTAGAMVAPEIYSMDLARRCWKICEACGHAFVTVHGFSGIARDCFGCAAVCRRFCSSPQ